MLGNGLVIAEMDEFCFFTGKPDSPQLRLKRLHNGSVETAGGQSLQPDNRHSGLPQRLCGNSISSRPDRKRNGTVNRDGFHGNRRSNFYSCRNGSTRFSLTWCFLQRSHFWTWCRIYGRLRTPALGRVFNANLTFRPEHAILYAEVINITFNVNSKKTFADISAICF